MRISHTLVRRIVGRHRRVTLAISLDAYVGCLYFLLPLGGLYPRVPAFFIAAIPSSTFSIGVVLNALNTPLEDTAMEHAAEVTRSGPSMIMTAS